MSKIDLSKLDQKKLQKFADDNKISRFLANKDAMTFEIGDVLIKNVSRWNSKINDVSWQTETVSHSNKMPQRYVCTYKDQHGICYVQELMVSTGSIGKAVYAVCDYDYSHIRFEVDPEFVESTILDSSFNIKDLHKKSLEQRKLISKMNRKIGIKPKNHQQVEEFFKDLKVGDVYYTAWDFVGRHTQEFTIVKLEHTKRKDVSSYYIDDYEKRVNLKIDRETEVLRVTCQQTASGRGNYNWWSFELCGGSNILFKQRPAKEDETK